MSGDVNGGAPVKRLRATLNDETQEFAFDDTNYTQLSQGWRVERLATVVCSSSATVAFDQLERGQTGPEIDDVVLSDDGATSGCDTSVEPPQITSPADGATLDDGGVTVAGNGIPAAMVTIRDGDVVVGHATVDVTGKWALTLPDVAAGAHIYTATQAVDAHESEASDPIQVAIRPRHQTSTTIQCTPATIVVGGRSACIATVTTASDSTTPRLVAFSTNGPGRPAPEQCQTVSTSPATSACSVEYVPTAVGTGSHTITAQTKGDTDHDAGTATATVSVSERSASHTALRCSPTRVRPGQPARCTVAVENVGTTASSVTGIVHFSRKGPGALRPSSCRLRGGPVARCRVDFMSFRRGRTTITATYAGNPAVLASAANAQVRTVVPHSPSVAESG